MRVPSTFHAVVARPCGASTTGERGLRHQCSNMTKGGCRVSHNTLDNRGLCDETHCEVKQFGAGLRLESHIQFHRFSEIRECDILICGGAQEKYTTTDRSLHSL